MKGEPHGQIEMVLRGVRHIAPLSALLVLEVPVPVGCSNPRCTDLSGGSELTAASKACSGCKVVRYCSRACQVAHCKQRLQQEQDGRKGTGNAAGEGMGLIN